MVITELKVSYFFRGRGTVVVPAVTVWRMGSGDSARQINDYRVFIDHAPLYEPHP